MALVEENLRSLSLQNKEENQSGMLRRLKVASNLFFVYNDEDGFGNAIAQALNPTKLFESFDLELGDAKLNGSVTQLGDNDNLKATMVMLDHLETPVLARAINSVLTKIADADISSSTVPTIIAPFLVPTSKLKLEGKLSTTNTHNLSLFSIQVGPETDVSRAIAAKTQKPPPSLQIHYEPLACFLHLVRAANLPTSIIIGQRSQGTFNQSASEDLETLCEIGELAASTTGTCFQREQTKTNWIPTAKAASGGGGEAWRAFYG